MVVRYKVQHKEGENIRVVIWPELLARAQEEAPHYNMTPGELIDLWSRYPDWAPGGWCYRSSRGRLPSSQPDHMIVLPCQEPPVTRRPIDLANVVIWTLIWGTAIGAIVCVFEFARLLIHISVA